MSKLGIYNSGLESLPSPILAFAIPLVMGLMVNKYSSALHAGPTCPTLLTETRYVNGVGLCQLYMLTSRLAQAAANRMHALPEMHAYFMVLLMEPDRAMLEAYVRLAGRVCKGPWSGAAVKGCRK